MVFTKIALCLLHMIEREEVPHLDLWRQLSLDEQRSLVFGWGVYNNIIKQGEQYEKKETKNKKIKSN
jgi:hypothetical protein